MKKYLLLINLILLLTVILNFSFQNNSFAKQSRKELAKEKYLKEMRDSSPKTNIDYEKIYKNLKSVDVEFIHDEDPDEYYDTQKIYFSPYPLIRLTQKLYFLDKVIQPGFYLLTPREYNGQKCVLFKEAGKVKYVVPVFDYKTVNPALEYQKPPKKWYHIRDRYTFQTQYYERKIHAFDVYSEYYEIDLYYRTGLSKLIFKKNPY